MPALVSIILPTYNRAALLPRAIDSVMRQTWTNWELIVVDDGSTDNTAELMRAFSEEPRIHLHRQEHSGPSAARNMGLKYAHGDYVCFLDSDDSYLPAHIELRESHMRQHHGTGLLCGGLRVIGPEDAMTVPDMHNTARRIPIDECVVGGTFFARAGVIEKAGGWRDMYGEDADLFERISRTCKVERFEHATYMYHRDTSDSRCSNT
jgi:glycosyltransferase involved in cell wall biosynthesis